MEHELERDDRQPHDRAGRRSSPALHLHRLVRNDRVRFWVTQRMRRRSHTRETLPVPGIGQLIGTGDHRIASVPEHVREEIVGQPYVSTGDLPDRDHVQSLVERAHALYRSRREGRVSKTYPALARMSPDLFGVSLIATSGAQVEAGDVDHEFTIMSVSKPFVFALVCARVGPERIREQIGVNSTGLPFNSVAAVEQGADGRTNPMVNAGAIAATSLIPGGSGEAKWDFLRQGLSRFAGRNLSMDGETYASASESNSRNQSIARLLEDRGRLYCDPAEAVDLYTRQCSLRVTARDLAAMGSTLADGGVNPVTGERVIDSRVCHHTLAVMLTAGLYESSGDWLYDVGLPAKSGIGGGIVTVSPGKGGMGTFSPPLDEAGNSVRGRLAAEFLSAELGMDLLTSAPSI
jgi:glutaminase